MNVALFAMETMLESFKLSSVHEEELASLALVAQQSAYGPWTTIINLLRGLLVVAGGLGFLMGLAVKSAAPTNSEAQETGNRMVLGALVGLAFGLLGAPLYDLIVEWTS